MYGSSISNPLPISKTHEVRRQLEFNALLQVGSAFAQQSLKSWTRDQYGVLSGFGTSNPQSRARISRASLQVQTRAETLKGICFWCTRQNSNL